jgi:hypothetical protein
LLTREKRLKKAHGSIPKDIISATALQGRLAQQNYLHGLKVSRREKEKELVSQRFISSAFSTAMIMGNKGLPVKLESIMKDMREMRAETVTSKKLIDKEIAQSTIGAQAVQTSDDESD